MAARILLVEDDSDLREAMAAALGADGHTVDCCGDGRAALDALSEGVHEIVLLDVALGPGLDGVEICRRMRAADDDAYVMMLTARGDESEVVLALEAGADDYVTKPTGIVELRSRVRAALRRMRGISAGAHGSAAPGAGALHHDALSLDPASRIVSVGGRPVDLTRSEFAVLEDLLRAGAAVRTRTELTRAIYGDDAYRDPRNIDVHMHNIREKLEAAGGDPSWLVTVRGTGYRLGR
jgi:DNA-binding response OmpR family regulator